MSIPKVSEVNTYLYWPTAERRYCGGDPGTPVVLSSPCLVDFRMGDILLARLPTNDDPKKTPGRFLTWNGITHKWHVMPANWEPVMEAGGPLLSVKV